LPAAVTLCGLRGNASAPAGRGCLFTGRPNAMLHIWPFAHIAGEEWIVITIGGGSILLAARRMLDINSRLLVTSLERLAIEKGLVTPEEMDARAAEYASGDRDEEGHIH